MQAQITIFRPPCPGSIHRGSTHPPSRLQASGTPAEVPARLVAGSSHRG